MQVAIPAGSDAGDGNGSQTTGELLSPPFPVYVCKWAGCKAQLHNLETLVKHTRRVHLGLYPLPGHDRSAKEVKVKKERSDKDVRKHHSGQHQHQNMRCRWNACTRKEPLLKESLWQHIQEDHLSRIAWQMGDGPRAVGSGEKGEYQFDDLRWFFISVANCFEDYFHLCTILDTKSYLYDRDGLLVTPATTAQSSNIPSIILPAAPLGVRDFFALYGRNTREAKASEVLRALETKQAKTGPLLVKEGCTFMTPERSRTVKSFENVCEIVDAEQARMI